MYMYFIISIPEKKKKGDEQPSMLISHLIHIYNGTY